MALHALTLAFILAAASGLPQRASLQCPAGFSQLGARCYLVSEAPYPAAEARAYCAGLGASVAVVEDQAEMDLLAGSLLTDTVYLGVDLSDHQHIVEGVLKEQGHSGYTNFKRREPNNEGGEDCVVALKGEDFKWNDVTCSAPYKVLCAADAAEAKQCDSDAAQFDAGTCFWHSGLNATFSFGDAVAACEGRGMALASIHSEEEQAFVNEFITEDTWIGLTDHEEEDVFVWVDGTSVDFEWWGTGEPNDNQAEDCVEITRRHGHHKQWNDKRCADLKSALCRGPTF